MRIGILQTGHVVEDLKPDFGDYDDMFSRLLGGRGFDFQTWNVVDGELPDSHSDADGWLITGSRFAVYEDHDWIQPLAAFLRGCYDAASPVAGICFGHQILAHALGGRVEKFKGGWSVGLNEYEFKGRRVKLNAWHQDQVVEPPAGAKVAGTSPNCEFAMLEYGGRAISIQPHPEFDGGFIARLIELRGRGIVPNELLREAVDRLGNPSDSDFIASEIAEFFLNPSARANGAQSRGL